MGKVCISVAPCSPLSICSVLDQGCSGTSGVRISNSCPVTLAALPLQAERLSDCSGPVVKGCPQIALKCVQDPGGSLRHSSPQCSQQGLPELGQEPGGFCRLVPPVFSRNPRHWLGGKVTVLPCGGAGGGAHGAVEVPVGQTWAQCRCGGAGSTLASVSILTGSDLVGTALVRITTLMLFPIPPLLFPVW